MDKNIKIGFIGLGAMGFPIATRLCKVGYHVLTAFHQNQEPTIKLKELGADVRDSFTDVILNSDIIFTILPADQQVRSVLLNEDVLNNLKKNKTLIEMTSCSPETMKEIAYEYEKRGVKVIDAPVSGGTKGAENGTLTLMIGGSDKVILELNPILDVIASNKVIVGEAGAGKAVKMINQMLASIHMLAASEAYSLAKQTNVNLETLKEVIVTSSGNSWIFQNKYKNLISENYDLGFRLRLMVKDINIALEEGKELPLPLTTLTSQVYKMVARENGELDISAVNKAILG